ncbi:unknown [Eggerthella sp. CAG:298]|nr:unknown [Eggerthella sp. CAG:298]
MIRHWHDARLSIFSIIFLSIERSYQILTISLCLVYALRICTLIRIGQLAVNAQIIIDGINTSLDDARLKRFTNSKKCFI